MGGREAIRGFAVQTLLCLLDSLQLTNDGWTFVTIEPDSSNDKVDILWEFSGGSRRFQQVKSSQNQIGRAEVVSWCSQLKASGKADSYQLMLAGPIAAAVIQEAPFDGVEVPLPASLDTLALIDQAITKFDRYLTGKAISPLPLAIRESLVYLVAARLLEGSVHGKKLSREEFDGWLLYWITVAYPEAIEQRLSANCSVLWSSIELVSPIELSNRAFELVIPITIINGGLTIAVIEWFLLCVSSKGREMRYRPMSILPEFSHEARRCGARPFGDFAVSPQTSVCKTLMFTPVEKEGYEVSEWPRGACDVELYVKYSSQIVPQSVKKVTISISIEDCAVLGTANTVHKTITSLDGYLDVL